MLVVSTALLFILGICMKVFGRVSCKDVQSSTTYTRDYDRFLVQEYLLYLYLFAVWNRVRVSECNSFMLNPVISKLQCWLCCGLIATDQSFKIIEDLFH